MDYYYHTDHLGSTSLLTDSSAAMREHLEYTPWHEQPKHKNIIGKVPGGVGENWYQNENMPENINFKFTGKELDPTGLYYFGARYYDPQVSLWMSPDKIEQYIDNANIPTSSDFSLYSYCSNNPIEFIDPDGLRKISILEMISIKSFFNTFRNIRDTEINLHFIDDMNSVVWNNVFMFPSSGVSGKHKPASEYMDKKTGLQTRSLFVHEMWHVMQNKKWGPLLSVYGAVTQMAVRTLSFTLAFIKALVTFDFSQFDQDCNNMTNSIMYEPTKGVPFQEQGYERQATIAQRAYEYSQGNKTTANKESYELFEAYKKTREQDK